MKPTNTERDMNLVHPTVRAKFVGLAKALREGFEKGETTTLFLPFETYRSPQRQLYLWTHTTSTKSQPWESAHQLGLAVDFAPHDTAKPEGRGWYWKEKEDPSTPIDWAYLKKTAKRFGLTVPIAWDKGHVQSAAWDRVRASFSG